MLTFKLLYVITTSLSHFSLLSFYATLQTAKDTEDEVKVFAARLL
jgi:hypothetical protein